MKAEAFLFDIGNVIITFDFGKAAARLASQCRVPVEEIVPLVSPLTPALERGEIEVSEFIDGASRVIGYEGGEDSFRAAFEDIFELNQPMAELIGRLSGSVALHLLSNTNGIHVPFFESRFPVFEHFEGRIYSHEVGLMKPDPAIYEHTAERLDLVPERTVYIDDLPENCEAGRRAGFVALPYEVGAHDRFLEAVDPCLP